MAVLYTLAAIGGVVALAVGLFFLAMRGQAAQHRRAQALRARLDAAQPRAREATARIVSSEPIGADTYVDSGWGQYRSVLLVLRIDDASGTDQRADWEVQVTAMPRVAPGETLTVALHPEHAEVVYPTASWARLATDHLLRRVPSIAC